MADGFSISRLSRRRFLTRSALAVGAIAGADTLLAACGSSSASGGTTTITVMHDASAVTKAYIQEFEHLNPGIKVTRLDYDATRLSAMLAANNAPDVIRTGGAPEIPNFAARGLTLDLDPYFARSRVLKTDNLMPVNDIYRWDGKQGSGPRYGMAEDWSQDLMLWYDKKVFDDAKVPYPDATKPMSFQELLDVAKRLVVRENGKIKVYGLDLGSGWVPYAALMQMLGQTGASLFNSDYSKADFTQPEVRSIFQWFVDYAQAHVGISPLDPDPGWGGTLMPAHRLGMELFGYWFGGEFTNQQVDSFGFAPAPQWGTSKRISACFSGTGIWIPKASKHPDEAWKFFEYFMAGTPENDRASSGFGIPTLKSNMSKMPQQSASRSQAYQVQQSELNYLDVLHFTPYVPLNAMVQVIGAELTRVMQNSETLDTAIANIQSQIGLLMDQGKSLIG